MGGAVERALVTGALFVLAVAVAVAHARTTGAAVAPR
jgi:hypothetical protein